jgi:hypothetical protein
MDTTRETFALDRTDRVLIAAALQAHRSSMLKDPDPEHRAQVLLRMDQLVYKMLGAHYHVLPDEDLPQPDLGA